MKPVERRTFEVSIYDSRTSMGLAAASLAGKFIRNFLNEFEEINVVFAAAPSQNEFLDALSQIEGIEWDRINAFHLDEYLELPTDSPQRFSKYLDSKIFKRVPFKRVYYVVPPGSEGRSPEELVSRYEDLISKHPLHIAFIGIGENGHIAFNEPSEADFNDDRLVKIVELEESSRRQQVNDGCFERIEDVPKHAITLTIPAVMNAKKIICVVPGERKREAVFRTLEGPVTESCPASVLRRHRSVHIFLDLDSAYLIRKG